MTVIVGLNAIGFNTSACVMIDGKIIAAVEEERLNREKKTRSFPEKSIEFCLKKSNLKFELNTLIIDFKEPFFPRRGRVNCSLNDNGNWRWFGTQFTVIDN